MVNRLPLLAGAVKVTLPDRAFAGAVLRRNREGHRMSTYEAVAQALGVVEGEAVTGPLLDFYHRATDRMLLVRGKLSLATCTGVSEFGDSCFRCLPPRFRIEPSRSSQKIIGREVAEKA